MFIKKYHMELMLSSISSGAALLFLGKPVFPIRWLPAAVHDGQDQNAMFLNGIKSE